MEADVLVVFLCQQCRCSLQAVRKEEGEGCVGDMGLKLIVQIYRTYYSYVDLGKWLEKESILEDTQQTNTYLDIKSVVTVLVLFTIAVKSICALTSKIIQHIIIFKISNKSIFNPVEK